MQKNIIFLVLGVPTFGEGRGVDLVGTKSQIFPFCLFVGSPKSKELKVKNNQFPVHLSVLEKEKMVQITD